LPTSTGHFSTVPSATSTSASSCRTAGVPIDVRVLNAAPLPFAYSVLQTGEVLVSHDEKARCDFVCRIYTHYHDFAYYRKRYRREALGLLR